MTEALSSISHTRHIDQLVLKIHEKSTFLEHFFTYPSRQRGQRREINCAGQEALSVQEAAFETGRLALERGMREQERNTVLETERRASEDCMLDIDALFKDLVG